MMPTLIFGKPFTVTEFNYVCPNRHRAEGGPLIGAYASLQNWDGLFRFSRAPHSAFVVKQQPIDVFEAANDPLAQLSERLTELKQSGPPAAARAAHFRHHPAAWCGGLYCDGALCLGIDTVIMTRCGLKQWLTYPSEVLMRRQNCYRPAADLVEMFLGLSDELGMKFFFGTYDSWSHWHAAFPLIGGARGNGLTELARSVQHRKIRSAAIRTVASPCGRDGVRMEESGFLLAIPFSGCILNPHIDMTRTKIEAGRGNVRLSDLSGTEYAIT